MKKIIFIPPKPPEPKKLKAAAYWQVSTLSPTPRCSIDWQIKSYIKMIPDHLDLVCAGVFLTQMVITIVLKYSLNYF